LRSIFAENQTMLLIKFSRRRKQLFSVTDYSSNPA